MADQDSTASENSQVPEPREETFICLLTSNHKRIYGFIRAIVPHSSDADDIMQETVITNVGITFDLEAMREVLAGARIVAFQARCGAMMGGQAGTSQRSSRAGFWVLVDGDVRFRRIEEHPGTATLVDIALNDHDRFLTLVTTDGGDGHQSDQCLFGDPALSLEPPR